MRRFAKLFMALAALGLAGVGCNPGDFDDLADDAWADSESSGMNSENRNAAISWAPRNDENEVPQFLIFGVGRDGPGDLPIQLARFGYSQNGTLRTAEPDADETRVANSESILLVGGDPVQGVFVGTAEDNRSGEYVTIGDFGRHTPPPENPEQGDTLTSRDRAFDSGGDGGARLDWRAISYSKLDPNGAGAVGTFAALGTQKSEDGDPSVLELQAFPEVTVDAPTRCEFDSMVDAGTEYNVNDTLAVIDGNGVPTDSLYLVGTDDGLRTVGFPIAPATVCATVQLSANGPIDGPIQIGEFTGEAGRDIMAVSLGNRVIFLLDATATFPIYQFDGGETQVQAPSGSSDRWGEAVAVGDFDDDGVNELAVGDPGNELVEIYEFSDLSDPVKVIEPFESRNGFGKSLAAVPFFDGKDLLVVGTDSDVITYFRLFTDEESDSDLDPR